MRLNGDLEVVRKVVDGALASLEANRERLDDLNVNPVPDGDTGTDQTKTVRAVDEAVDPTDAAYSAVRRPVAARCAASSASSRMTVSIVPSTGRPLMPELLVELVRRGED